ncbi:MAG: DNA internalization-related competence protein ComEC/Rec2 [Lachnospiraceae bacterium]|nr:DNA internalization-related competence protein ComEC/Rec2 [Lachnospiraceae bacterium]
MIDLDKILCRPCALWGAAAVTGAAAGGYEIFYGGDGRSTGFLTVAAIAAFAAGLIHIVRAKPKGRIYLTTVWLLSFVFAVSGFMRMREEGRESELKSILTKGTDAQVAGTADYISVRPDGYRITLRDAAVKIRGRTYTADGILLSVSSDTGIQPEPGDTVIAKGRAYPFEKATNPGQFDSDMYYRIRRLDAGFSAAGAAVRPGGGHRIGAFLYHIRTYLSDNIFRILPEQEGSVLNSILTGDRGMLESDLKDLYSEGGIAHILSISSLHVSLLGLGIYRLLVKLTSRMRLSAAATLFVMYCFLSLTGGSVSTSRAVIMLTVMLAGRLMGRRYDMLNTAGAAAIILLLIQPLYIYDPGFRLSFLAVLGIFTAGEVVRVWNIKHVIARSLIMSSFVWLLTLPAVISSYFCVNLLSVAVNILILPMMSILLPAGYAAAATGFAPVAGPVYYILRLYTAICEKERSMPYIRPVVGMPHTAAVTAYYSVMALFLLVICRRPYLKKEKRPHEKRKNLPLLLLLAGCAVIFVRPADTGLFAAFLDVGQGDAIYAETDGVNILMDAGSSNVTDVGRYRVIPFLKSRGITKIDHVIISHTDKDHISAVKEMLELGYPQIGELCVGVNTDTEQELIGLAREKGVRVRYVCAGEEIAMPESISKTDEPAKKQGTAGNCGLSIKILAPETGFGYSDVNSGSVVALLGYCDFKLLLTGDSGFESEKLYTGRLRDIGPLTVLKCAHHGSRYSSSADMLRAARPAITVISCYKYNTYGHPHPLTLDRLMAVNSDIYCTADSGAVLIGYDGGLTVEEYGKKRTGPVR